MAGGGARRDPGRRHGARLDQIGNTTKALTKGFAIATAVVAAIALFRSFIDEAGLFVNVQDLISAGAQQAGGVLSRGGLPGNLPLILIRPLICGGVALPGSPVPVPG